MNEYTMLLSQWRKEADGLSPERYERLMAGIRFFEESGLPPLFPDDPELEAMFNRYVTNPQE